MVSLSKVTLEKKGQSISLEKNASGYGRVHVNLNWSRPAKKGGLLGGLFGGGAKGVDLDLGAFVELADGSRHVVQALGNSFGAFTGKPFVNLAGDDRTGDAEGGEDLFINGDRWPDVRRILVYAFIYEAAPNWAETNGVVTVEAPGQAPLEVRMTDGNNGRSMCAICTIENDGGKFKVTKLSEYFRGHQDMDRAYDWGFSWTAGSK